MSTSTPSRNNRLSNNDVPSYSSSPSDFGTTVTTTTTPVFDLSDLVVKSTDLIYDAPPAYQAFPDPDTLPLLYSNAGFNTENTNLRLPILLTGTFSDANGLSENELGPEPVLFRCRCCGYVGSSSVRHVAGSLSWFLYGVMFMIGCCFCVPFISKGTEDVIHKCPRCSFIIGRYERE